MLHWKTFNTLRSEKYSTIFYLFTSWFHYLYLNTYIPGIYFGVQYGSNFIPKCSPINQYYLMVNINTWHAIFIIRREREFLKISLLFLYLYYPWTNYSWLLNSVGVNPSIIYQKPSIIRVPLHLWVQPTTDSVVLQYFLLKSICV